MRNISITIADILWRQGIIQEEDVATCRYGLELFMASAFEVISILIISFFACNFFETLLFFVAFIPLRIYAGGYHADTQAKCYFVSLGVYGVFTVVLNILFKEMFVMLNILLTILSLIVILIYAPVIHKNKSVNDIEIKYYRKFSIIVSLVESIIILLLTVILPDSSYIVSLAIGQAAVTISIIVAIIKGKITDNK